MSAHTAVIALLALPLLGAAVALAVRNGRLAATLCTGTMGLALIPAAVLLQAEAGTLWLGEWFSVAGLQVGFRILLSPVSALLAAAVVFISLLIHVFSVSYIRENQNRFFSTLALFTASMLGLILSDHLIVLFCCWELMGICSYLLIGFWRNRLEAGRAATEAMLINKAGDVCLLGAILLLFSATGSWALSGIANQTLSLPVAATAGGLLFVAIAAKSAQFPLHTWLPRAMAGPTPVSAFIHAATLVAAGVILYSRVHAFLPPAVHAVFAAAALITALLGAWQALLSHNIKEILAFSTLSQLGLMMASVALGAGGAGLLHLFCHAFYKAGLFLAAGMIIQANRQAHPDADAQDIRRMSGLRSKHPKLFVLWAALLAALCGVPLLSGFLSKEAMVAGILAANPGSVVAWFVTVLFFLAGWLTVAYSWRLLYAVFLREPGNPGSNPIGLPALQWAPIVALAAGSGWYVVSLHPLAANGWSSGWFELTAAGGWALPAASAAWVLLAWLFARHALRNGSYRGLRPAGISMRTVLDRLVLTPVLRAGQLTEQADKKWIDGLLHGLATVQVAAAHLVAWLDNHLVDGAVRTVASITARTGNLTRRLPDGRVQQYLLAAVLGLVIFLLWMLN
jgi:NADH-quinone oxidoreductase subunit L